MRKGQFDRKMEREMSPGVTERLLSRQRGCFSSMSGGVGHPQ
ncbi:hypothetical protein RESH_02470 [Rhodopirellula europaea SH398]|uniref:Uncharacterized protein n=1 Tax=Rhodopirellula europaea SH398 TaxID=1263868 RepID=M5S623_9BACT|nr:hypothetical protein RESH_02470 [Rhodopirellula europaea SH398]